MYGNNDNYEINLARKHPKGPAILQASFRLPVKLTYYQRNI